MDKYTERGSSQRSLLEQRLDESDLEEDSVNGKFSESASRSILHYQLGLTDYLNLIINFSAVNYRQTSDLKTDSSTDTAAVEFIKNHQTSSSSGAGDYELGVVWRFSYGDEHDLRLSLLYNHNNGKFILGDNQLFSPGSGTKELTTAFLWTYYPLSNRSQVDFSISSQFSQKATVKTSQDKKVELQRGQLLSSSIGYQRQQHLWNYGLKLAYKGQDNSHADGIRYEDGFTQYSYNLHLGWSKITGFREFNLPFPLEARAYLENVFRGVYSPVVKKVGLDFSAYF